jgi:hypothetical protein
MFAQLKERLAALREFNAVRQLRWGMPDWFGRVMIIGWMNAIVQSLLYTALWWLHVRVDLWVPAILMSFISCATVLVVVGTTIANLYRNLPQIIAFLRDPTFENE